MGLYHDKAYKKEVVPGVGTIVVGEKPPVPEVILPSD
jgi:hypothetical protein